MAAAMMVVMTGQNSSILYHLISFDTDKQYVGLVEERPGILRAKEHWTNIEIGASEPYYVGMKKTGGAAAWYFIPVVSCEGRVSDS